MGRGRQGKARQGGGDVQEFAISGREGVGSDRSGLLELGWGKRLVVYGRLTSI